MRETIEPNETIEKTINRGLMEEFGMIGNLIHYIGSIVANDEWFGEIKQPTIVEKTTLYFLVKVDSVNLSKRLKNDGETDSDVISLEVNELIYKMDELEKKSRLSYIGESKILKSLRSQILKS